MRADVLEWMERFERLELERHPHTLFRAASIASTASKVTGTTPTPTDVETILSVTPPAIIDTFVVDDHLTANVLFAIGPVSLAERSRLIDDLEADMRSDLRPPEGVSATPSGLAVVGIAAVDALSANRWQMALAAMAGVLVWLLIAIRKPVPALLALAPVLAALGGAWSLIYALGISVNSLSALSSPLVVAVGTEFGVLVVERHREERSRGATPDEATAIAAARIGRAFVASGLATAGGFGVLAISGFPLLANFGAVVAIDLLVTVLSALVVLPPLLRAADTHLGAAAS
jgi:predicted RND superfamily exporter protein